MDEFVFNQGAIQKSLGDTPLHGLIKPDFKVVVELEPLEDGQPAADETDE